MVTWLRWIAVLPSALIAMFLSAFPLHFVLYQTLTNSGFVEPYPEAPERLLLPLVAAVAFIWAGSYVAPSHKVRVATVLFAVWVLALVGLVIVLMSGSHLGDIQFSLRFGGFGSVMALIGAVSGLYIVRKQNQNGTFTAPE